MLNMPDSVKALFALDECRKNFRVHFPNGEHADLTNSDVVWETVSFSESVCSQNTLRFGLSEASRIEFETVGVPNIMGAIIECACEIDTSGLTAAEIAAIQAGTWDGQLVLSSASDIGYGFFRVPYGRFRVDSCPRNHGAMTHRKVTAYTTALTATVDNSFERQKMALPLPGNLYHPNTYLLAMSLLGAKSENFLLDQGFTRSEVAVEYSEYDYFVMSYKRKPNTTVTVQTNITYAHTGSIGNLTQLYGFDMHGGSMAVYADRVIDILKTLGYEPVSYSWAELAQLWLDGIDTPNIDYDVQSADTSERARGYVYLRESNYAFYPKRDNDNGTVTCYAYYPSEIKITINGTQYTILSDEDAPTIYRYASTNPYVNLSMLINPTAEQYIENYYSPQGPWIPVYSYADAFNFTEFLNAYLETIAAYGVPERDGTCGILHLSRSSPVSVARSQYEEMWWDEYDVEPVGTIQYAITDSGGRKQELEYAFGAGRSVYDMRDNIVLRNLQYASAALVEQHLRDAFIPHLGALAFTPTELNMAGLPYLEAGDYLAIAAEDGTVVNTYVLSHEQDGIQRLTDEIRSEGGTIIAEG